MDIVLILDTETTGFDHANDACLEVAVVEYSIKHMSVLGCFSAVMTSDKGNAEAEKINHIPLGILDPMYGRTPVAVWGLVERFARRSAAVLAHNSDFDKGWVPPEHALLKIPWIDTCFGVNWPLQSRAANSLINLAFEHGLGIDSPHRALADCLLIARLMTRCAELGYDVGAILARGLRPQGYFMALVSYEDRQLAKDAEFKWQSATKTWERKMAVEDAKALPFQVKRLR